MPRRKLEPESEISLPPPMLTEEGRENVCVSLATDLAEKQLRDGTASPSVIVHYLKLGSPKARLETELLKADINLKKAKAKATETEEETLRAYTDAMKAFGIYSGERSDEEDEYGDEY